MYQEELPRTGWAEILLLAERLAPKPALIPSDAEERALMFGIAHEIAGEMGLGWCRRLGMIDAGAKADPPSPISAYLGSKYGAYPESMPLASGRVLDVLHMLTNRLAVQRAAGHRYLMGQELSALDVYWAAFCNLLSPLSPERMPMTEPVRAMFSAPEPAIAEILAGGLLDHRDFLYEEHLVLPVIL